MKEHRTSPFRYLAAAAAGAALMIGGVAVGGVALAEENDPASTTPTSAVVVGGTDLPVEDTGSGSTNVPAECGVFFDGPLPGELGPDDQMAQELIDQLNADTGFDGEAFGPDEMPQELIDELNADADALAAHLDAAGVAYTVVDDEGGLRYLDWDFDDEAANDAVDAFYDARYGDDELFEHPDDEFELPEGCERYFVDDCGDDVGIHQNEEDDVDLPAAA